MGFLSDLKTDDSIEAEQDSLGGGSRILESGIYDFTVSLAYLDYSQGGAKSLNVTLTNAAKQTVREQLWMTSGKAKGQKNYYEDKNGKKKYLPGFITANHLSLITTGEEISELEPEEKTINLYNFDMKKEVPTKKQVITEMLGKEVTVAVLKKIVDKNVKDADGNYVPSGETREINEIDKVFTPDTHLTVVEIRAENEEPKFYNDWAEKNTGKTRNQTSAAKTQQAPAAESKPKKSLFNK